MLVAQDQPTTETPTSSWQLKHTNAWQSGHVLKSFQNVPLWFFLLSWSMDRAETTKDIRLLPSSTLRDARRAGEPASEKGVLYNSNYVRLLARSHKGCRLLLGSEWPASRTSLCYRCTSLANRTVWRDHCLTTASSVLVIFDIRAHSDAQPWAWECPGVKNYKWRLNPVWHKMP